MRSAGAKPSASVARSVVAGVVDRHAGSRGKGAQHRLVVGVELRAPQAQDALAARVASDAGDGLLVDPDGEELLDRSSPQHAERPVLRVDLDDRRLHDAAQHHRQVRRSRAPGRETRARLASGGRGAIVMTSQRSHGCFTNPWLPPPPVRRTLGHHAVGQLVLLVTGVQGSPR
ncbi:hypothetical protein ACIF83_06925 [Streptomyces sp. NPDC085866]|uniref:hypothetical protein n=1 Tax=Streptomyces sp. NPDC085866 TaxID=3365736 RepID=UPI0037CE115C